jgi:hypothetical protein
MAFFIVNAEKTSHLKCVSLFLFFLFVSYDQLMSKLISFLSRQSVRARNCCDNHLSTVRVLHSLGWHSGVWETITNACTTDSDHRSRDTGGTGHSCWQRARGAFSTAVMFAISIQKYLSRTETHNCAARYAQTAVAPARLQRSVFRDVTLCSSMNTKPTFRRNMYAAFERTMWYYPCRSDPQSKVMRIL